MVDMDKLFCFLLAGGKGTRLKSLTNKQSKAMVNICSSYHLIDFALASCYMANIDNLGVITQYDQNSLIEYLMDWKTFINYKLKILPPKASSFYEDVKYYDTAQSVFVNMDITDDYEDIMIVHCDHVYSGDYKNFYEKHLEYNSDLTVYVREIPIEEASRFGIFTVDENNKVIDFEEKPENPKSNLISMGIYIYKKESLLNALKYFDENNHKAISFSKDIVPYFVENLSVNIVKFDDFWEDVGTIDSLWKLNMMALDKGKDFFDILNFKNTNILTKKVKLKPSVMDSATFTKSFCGFNNEVNGVIEHSVLGNNITIEEGAHVINSVIFDSCVIKKGVTVKNAMISEKQIVEKDFGSEDTVSIL